MTAWPLVPLGEVVEPAERWEVPANGTCYRQLGVRLWGEGAYERESMDGSETKYAKLNRVEAGDLVVNKIWARNGSVAVVPSVLKGCYVSSEFPTFRPIDTLDSQWLHWLTKTRPFWNQCDEKSRGTSGKNRIRPEQFLSIQIPLPPLEEQRRIVERIREISARIRDAKRLAEESDQLTNSLIHSIAKAIFNHERWSMTTVEELVGRANLKNGLSLKSDGLESDIRCLRLSAMRHGVIDCSDSKPIAIAPVQASPYLIRSDDVFIVRGNGSKDLVGQAGIVKDHLAGTIFPDLFIRVPLDQERILSAFFVAWWNSPMMRDKITDAAKTTSGIWKINQGHIASFPVPVTPISDQLAALREIEAHASRTAKLQALRSAASAKLQAILPSLLNQAFSGQF